MLDELCTDILYRIPLDNKYSDWEFALRHLDPLTQFRQRYPNLRLHLSVPDYFLITTSTAEMAHLVAYLVKMQAVSLDVIVDPTINLGVLYHVLLSYRDILPPGKQLSISVSHLVNPHALYEQGIIETVDKVYAIPPRMEIIDPTFPTERKRGSLLMDSLEFIRNFQNANIPPNKLVLGVLSAHISASLSTDLSTIPTMAEICDGPEFSAWRPRRLEDDQLIWSNPKKNWSFRMLMGNSVTDQICSVSPKDITFMIFDVSFSQPTNPVCSRHKDYFVQAVHQAITTGPRPQPREIEVEQFPQWTTMGGGRLGQILVYATEGEEEAFKNYFNITDDNSFLASPIEQVAIGYNSEGEIYDIYQDNCDEEPALSSHLEHLVERYALETIISEADVYGSLLPPSILIFPGASNASAVNFHHPAPILITWFQKRASYPVQWTDEEYQSWMEDNFDPSTPTPRYTVHSQASRRPDPSTYLISPKSIEIDLNTYNKTSFGKSCTHRLRTKLPKKLGKYSAEAMFEATNSTTDFNEIFNETLVDATLEIPQFGTPEELPPMVEQEILTHFENEHLVPSNGSVVDELPSPDVSNEPVIDYEIPNTFDDIIEQLPTLTTTSLYETTLPTTNPAPLKNQGVSVLVVKIS